MNTRIEGLAGARVLVTGATGFLGANLVPELLAQGASVHALSRGTTGRDRLGDRARRVTFHVADLSDAQALCRAVDTARPDIIYHLAVQRRVDSAAARAAAVGTNIVGMVNLLEAAAGTGYQRLVCLGSSLEYGPRDEAARESDPLHPTSFYGATKAAATLLCRQAVLAEQRPIVSLRPYLLYGPWDAPHHLIPAAIRAAMGEGGGRLPLTTPGYRRDWVFVEDVVDACLRATVEPGAVGEILNIGTGSQWTNEQVVETVEEVTGRRIDVCPGSFPARPTDRECWVADVRKARDLLGWEPRHTLREGIGKTYEWISRRTA